LVLILCYYSIVTRAQKFQIVVAYYVPLITNCHGVIMVNTITSTTEKK